MKTARFFTGLFLFAVACDASAAERPTPAVLEAPACGARIFVAMGRNQKFPTRDNMRIPRGEVYLDSILVDIVSKDPEIGVIDVPAGKAVLSWMPAAYDKVSRGVTKQNVLTLTLGENETAFVVLDWFDDTPATREVSYRTEVVKSSSAEPYFSGQRVAFHLPLPRPCAPAAAVAAAPPAALPPSVQPSGQLSIQPSAPPRPQQQAALTVPPRPQAPDAPAAALPEPAPQRLESELSQAFITAGQFYYKVSARGGAPAFAEARAEGKPLHTFPEAAELPVLDVSPDKRWLRVALSGKRVGYVSTSVVIMGARAPKE